MSVTALTLEVKVGESVLIDGRITMTLQEKSGQRARLRFLADEIVSIVKNAGKAKSGSENAKLGIAMVA